MPGSGSRVSSISNRMSPVACEGAAAGEVHAIVAEGRGGEEAIKSGADLLARAQALHG